MKVFSRRNMCFVIMLIAILFRYLSPWDIISQRHRYYLLGIIIFTLFIQLLSIKITKRNLFIIIIILLLGILDFVITKEIDILMSLILAFIFLFEDGDRVFIKDFFLISSFCYIITIILYMLNIIDNTEFIRSNNNEIIYRNSLGFANPNHAFAFLIPVLISFYLLFWNRKKTIIMSFAVLIVSYLVFIETDCRTGLYSMIMFIIFILLDKNIEKKMSSKMKYMFLIMTLASYAIAFIFQQKSSLINQLLTNRPYNAYRLITNYSISLFGNRKALIDNCYLWLIYRHGLLVYGFYFGVYYSSVNYFLRSKKLFISILIVFIYSLFENTVNYAFNPLFILCIIYLLNNNDYKMYFLNNKNEQNYSD